MMRKCSFTLSLLLVVLVSIVLLGTGSSRAAQPLGPVKLLSMVPVPVSATNTTGGMYSFDISWVDRTTGTYYLADRSNKVVDVVVDETTVTQLTGDFTGFTPCAVQPAGANDCAGPNGVATSANCLFVTDAPSRVVSFT